MGGSLSRCVGCEGQEEDDANDGEEWNCINEWEWRGRWGQGPFWLSKGEGKLVIEAQERSKLEEEWQKFLNRQIDKGEESFECTESIGVWRIASC
jgi:hypothetical protein